MTAHPVAVCLQKTAAGAAQSFLALPTEKPAVFAPAKAGHTIIENPLFTSDSIGSVIFSQVLDTWFQGLAPTVSYIDSSSG